MQREGFQERLVREVRLHRENIANDEEAEFRKAAGYVLGLSEAHLAELVGKGQFSEVPEHGEEVPE